MRLLFYCIATLATCGFSVFTNSVKAMDTTKQWTGWTECSASCGEGQRKRWKICNSTDTSCGKVETQTKSCFLRYCPSYLSWPRIHFSGELAVDPATVNNFRCAYDNEMFSAFMQTQHYTRLNKMTSTHTYYEKSLLNWNPDGSNQIYFLDTRVTSFCTSPNNCSLTDSIVGSTITESVRGVIVVLDPDWQKGEIWALSLHIPGVLDGTVLPAIRRVTGNRVDNLVDSYGYEEMARIKSKLVNITWHDGYYKKHFSNALELSMTLVIDLFDSYAKHRGRISGTIGLTSPDDAKQTTTTRVLQSTGVSLAKKLRSAPFFIHYTLKTLTVDLSFSVKGNADGSFPTHDMEQLDLALLLTRKEYCRYYGMESSCLENGAETLPFPKRITYGGEITKRIGNDSAWYLKYAGVMDIDLSHLDETTLEIMKNTRLAIIDSNDEIYLEEFPHGVNFGMMDFSLLRLDPGESGIYVGFVSSFGRPAAHAQFNLNIVGHEVADAVCSFANCNRSMSVPLESINIPANDHPLLTNHSGFINLEVKAIKDPGNPRGCGLDGQVYLLQVWVRYSKEGRSYSFSDYNFPVTDQVKPSDYLTQDMSTAVRIYSHVPEKICPTWKDVKDIFIQYHNLYPVMWQSGVIDLHSYSDILKKSKMLKSAMFDLDIYDPRYMPMSRDLSNGKKKLIYNWMKCGMKREEPISQKEETACSDEQVKKKLVEVRKLLQRAMMLELSTIPPYVTAWLSLKFEFGRNKEIADIMKSTFDEEMLHMTLDGNILNAIGGVVNMTDVTMLPVYPTTLMSGDSYQILPDVQVGLAPFSIGVVQDVFSMVEKPSRKRGREILYKLGTIWKILPSRDEEYWTPLNMKSLLRESEKQNFTDSANLTKIYVTNSTHTNETRLKHNLQSWKNLAEFANENLESLNSISVKTVGEFYTLLALKLTSLETCLQMRSIQSLLRNNSNATTQLGTIFTGDIVHQLNISHWYQKSNKAFIGVMNSMNGDTAIHFGENEYAKSRPPLFQVTDLKTAIEAIVEITYQGESGSECSPFVPQTDVYASEKGRDDGGELSHYYRFQEIANGRRLIKVSRPSECVRCLNISQPNLCPSLVEFGEQYCYAGNPITFYEDGVWPILSNPQEQNYRKGTKADILHKQFNVLYTRLLYCLEKAFGGNPFHIRKCMSNMYDLTITGKKLVQTPLRVFDNTTEIHFGRTGRNGAPTWLFVRDLPYRAGLPLYQTT